MMICQEEAFTASAEDVRFMRFLENREHGARAKSTILHFRNHLVKYYFAMQDVRD